VLKPPIANRRIHVHFTPTWGSWLVDVSSGIIERQAMHRRTFASATEPNGKIRAFIDGWNDRAHPLVWTKRRDQILKKADRQKTSRARLPLVAGHTVSRGPASTSTDVSEPTLEAS
jgi:hypothetical protein